MTKAELIEAIANATGESKAAVDRVLGALGSVSTEALKSGGEVILPGLGKLVTAQRAAREGRNPASGEPLHIAASNTAKFKPLAALKAALN